MSERLYKSNVYIKECDSVVTAVPKPDQIVLDSTLFFPEGGGQPADSGTINGIPIVHVFEQNGEVIHQLALPVDGSNDKAPLLLPGSPVHCVLDWERRFDHMQRHCGEHILSGIFFRVLGGVNRGFHMGDDYMTIDIDVPSITPETAARIELEANQVIWSDAPVSTRCFSSREEAVGLPLRKEMELEKDITVVSVGSEQEPADCVACCGTHPSSAGQVGIVKILKIENHKGMIRVYFEAGKRAYLDYARKHDISVNLMDKYSADIRTLPGRLLTQEEKNSVIRQEYHKFRELLMDREADLLSEEIAAPDGDDAMDSRIVAREYDCFTSEDLQILAKKISARGAQLFILISTAERTLVLCTGNAAPKGKFDCGKLVRELAVPIGGKGGGNASMARVAFPSFDEIDRFINAVVDLS